jgi:hypothetical protein
MLKGNFASSVFHSCNAKTQTMQICVTGPQCVNIIITVGREEWQGKVSDREDWKRLLRTARNHRILHMPME